jgi:hypothetical protein
VSDRGIMAHPNDRGQLENRRRFKQLHSKELTTYVMKPDVKAASTGMTFPLLSLAGVISNTLRIEATAMNMEFSAIA